MAGPDLLERRDPGGRGGRGGRPAGHRARRRRRAGRRRGVAALATVVVAAAITGGVMLTHHAVTHPQPACSVPSASGPAGATYSLSPDQAQNAAIIAAVAHAKGLPDHAVTIALATALQESELVNLPYGDRDSVGLFQQRPSQGWGTQTQLLDPVYATGAFYAALVKVPGWGSMAVTQAAQAVQQSADGSAYAQWEDEARSLAVTLTGETQAAFACRFDSFAGAVPGTGALQQAMSSEMGADLIGVPLGSKTGWAAASWVVAHAYNYHVSRVTFAGWTWRASSGKWAHGSAGKAADVVTVTAATVPAH